MDDRELEHLLQDIESDRVERKESLSDGERIHQAICAFANDLPNHQRPGVVFVGAADDGSGVGLPITDELLRALSDVREHLLPWPAMTVEKRRLRGCDMAVIVVEPADAPPVRYKGVVWIRVGPRRARATSQEERILAEKRRSKDLPFDLRLWTSASLDDLDLELFRRVYIPCAVSPDVIEENDRSLEQQLAALRFATSGTPMYPTVTGLLTIGKMPSDSIPAHTFSFCGLMAWR